MQRALPAAILGAALFGGAAQAATVEEIYTSFWVLGDSLSDTGNASQLSGGAIPSSPPYVDGRFSNGPVWADPLIARFAAAGRPARSFAVGGAKATTDSDAAPDLDLQSLAFLGNAVPVMGDRPLVTLWFGGNDVIAAGRSGNTSRAEEAAEDVLDAVEAFSALGVQDFIMPSLPDVGLAPAFAVFDPTKAATASAASSIFNATLSSGLADYRAAGLNILEIDSQAILETVTLNPAAYGVTETQIPCVQPSLTAANALGRPLVCDPATANEYIYFDAVHPTANVHGIFADTVVAELAPVPLPMTAGLLMLGVASAALMGRRR